ncbi:hypothetical protein SSBR45G_19810 [Bradyrhizobium sp. SSBR45G]|nr:hypothetical protein SSBR45G_19810 [Bradyrhizobium sp. SSBR45G]GLH83831.1 hypothetical protein SSBR45R_12910 [Bradyrhizobium sp. SSBR45R]
MAVSARHVPARLASEVTEGRRRQALERPQAGRGRGPLDKIRRILQLGKLEGRKDTPRQWLKTDFGP